jgi:hypothetical protein
VAYNLYMLSCGGADASIVTVELYLNIDGQQMDQVFLW